MVNTKDVFRTQSNIFDGAFFAKAINGFQPLTIFAKGFPYQMFDWVLNTPLKTITSHFLMSPK